VGVYVVPGASGTPVGDAVGSCVSSAGASGADTDPEGSILCEYVVSGARGTPVDDNISGRYACFLGFLVRSRMLVARPIVSLAISFNAATSFLAELPMSFASTNIISMAFFSEIVLCAR